MQNFFRFQRRNAPKKNVFSSAFALLFNKNQQKNTLYVQKHTFSDIKCNIAYDQTLPNPVAGAIDSLDTCVTPPPGGVGGFESG